MLTPAWRLTTGKCDTFIHSESYRFFDRCCSANAVITIKRHRISDWQHPTRCGPSPQFGLGGSLQSTPDISRLVPAGKSSAEAYRWWRVDAIDRKSTRLNSSH